ncbi:phage major capsid protein [Stieleria sp. JC731]|uniref:phage major capsid protein n=1 Tax=Pirellulaceae TaxID=2691357 RepID=UPI001E5904A1|nr:phage major capsid protein [Stieleria sp. JC731]MCC9600766.1 phage major capsid protein [Stieleria sp. JC731]
MTITRERLNKFRDSFGSKVPGKIKLMPKDQAFGRIQGTYRAPENPPKNAFTIDDGIFEETVLHGVVHQLMQTSVVSRFSYQRPIMGGENLVPTLKARTAQVLHHARVSSSTISGPDSHLDAGSAMMGANQRYVYFKASRELAEDALDIIGVCSIAAGDALAKDLDRIAFTGLNNEADGFVLGILESLRTSSIKVAATGNTSAATLDAQDFANTIGLLPEFETPEPPRWFMSRSFYTQSVLRLAGEAALLAVPPDDADGLLFGHKVHFVGGMPASTAAAGAKVAVFGYLGLGTIYGVLEKLHFDSIRDFVTDQRLMRFSTYDDFVCWDNGTNNPSDPAGSLVALQLAEV